MSANTIDEARPVDRVAAAFAELAELAGQRNAIDARIVEVVARLDREDLIGLTGARSVPALVAWKLGASPAHARAVAAVAARAEELPRCVDGLRAGRLSLDQVGVIAQRGGQGGDAHYAELASSATVAQLRTAIDLEPHPDPEPPPVAARSVVRSTDEGGVSWRIRLPRVDAAVLDAALRAHRDALLTDWTRERDEAGGVAGRPMPDTADAFLALVRAGWDAQTAARPHGQHTTVVVHVDTTTRVGSLHLGPVLTDEERRELTCDATCEAWFTRAGRVIGAGRAARTVGRRLRRVLEHRDRSCRVPGCAATRGLHAHHLVHWEDGGPTDPDNLVLLCPHHHRQHHQGGITITGPAHALTVTDPSGHPLAPGSLAHTPTRRPPDVDPYPGPTGERADWWWYHPYQPPTTNTAPADSATPDTAAAPQVEAELEVAHAEPPPKPPSS